MADTGDYIWLMTTDGQKVFSHGFRLKVIPSESSNDLVMQHKEDKTYVKISAVDRAMEKLIKHQIVILKGREGTGKSKMCLEIAARCEDQYQYLPVIVTSKKEIKEEFDNNKVLYIVDQAEDMDLDKFKELYKFLLERTMSLQAWTIISCRNSYETEMSDENFLDCDSILSTEEREKILTRYMVKHNVGKATSAHCNFREKEILDNPSIHIILDKRAINEIITTEPLQGFPLVAKNFCEDRRKLHLGEKFFTNPPKEIVDRMIELRETAIRVDDCQSFLMFCLLIYLTTKRKYINMKEIKTWYIDFKQVQILLAKNVFKLPCLKESLKANLQDSHVKEIHNAVNKMIGTYLKVTGDIYEFIHPYMSKATFLSTQYFATYGLVDSPIEYILEFIRSCKYNISEEGMVLKIDNIHILCERLVKEITVHSEKVTLSQNGMLKELEKQARVCKYIYDEWVKLRDEEFCRKLFNHIDAVFCLRTEDRNNLQAWHILCLMYHVTCNGMDPWIYSIQNIPDMAVIFGLIYACYNRYSLKEQKRRTCEMILEILGNRLSSSKEDQKKRNQSSVKLTDNDKSSLQIDKYGNTLFHYLCLYSEDEACQIIDKYIQCMNKICLKECLQMKNEKMIQAIHLAVALGKFKIIDKIKTVIEISMMDDKEGNIVLEQILQYVKDVYILKKDSKNLSAFDLDKNFNPEISISVTHGSREDFEKVLKLFPVQ